jgi:hypothetical protein
MLTTVDQYYRSLYINNHFLIRLIFLPWRWKQHIPPKIQHHRPLPWHDKHQLENLLHGEL